MDADHVVDDELKAGQADAAVGDLGEFESEFRVAHVHHDLHRDLGQVAHVGGDHFIVELAAVHITGVAFGTGNGHVVVLVQHFGGVAATDNGGNAELAGDDRRVAGTAATVGDDGRSTLHHRLPVRVGHVGNQHVAGLDAVHLGSVLDHANLAGADLLANGATVGEGLAVLLEAVLFHHVAGLLALHGFRTGLQDVQLAVVTALAPLDVHRAAVVLLDDHGVAAQLEHVGVGQGVHIALGFRDVDGTGGLAGFLLVGKHHLDQLGTQVAADDGRLSLGQGGLVNVELVGVHGALHHGFAEAVGRGDEHHAVEAGFGVHGEHHAGGADVGTHHALHAGRQGDFSVGEALVHAVGDGPVVVQGREHFLDGVEDVLVAVDVQEGFLLAGEGRVGQVFGSSGRAHGEAAVAFGGQLLVGGLDLDFEGRREGGIDDPLADLGATAGQGHHIIHIQAFEGGADTLGQPQVGQELAVGIGGGGKATGHAHAGGQLADHFAEGGVLAANLLDIGHAQLLEGNDVTGHKGIVLGE